MNAHPMLNILARARGDRENVVYTVAQEPTAARKRYLRRNVEALEAKSYRSSADNAQLGAWRQELATM